MSPISPGLMRGLCANERSEFGPWVVLDDSCLGIGQLIGPEEQYDLDS